MYSTFNDVNADKMLALAKTITQGHSIQHDFVKTPAVVSLSKAEQLAHPITRQFFAAGELLQSPSTAQPMSENVSASELDQRFREKLRALYPGIPSLWDTPRPRPQPGNVAWTPPDVMDSSTGGMSSSAKGLQAALQKNAAARSLKRAVDAGEISKQDVAAALRSL